jgi:hypothetical protein
MKERKRLRGAFGKWHRLFQVSVALLLAEDAEEEEEAQDSRDIYLIAAAAACEGMHCTSRHLHRGREFMQASDFPKMKTFNDFKTERVFRFHFRFDRPGFLRILRNFGWLDEAGQPIWLNIGKGKSTWSARADWVFMVLCRRLSFPGRIEDTCTVLGGSRTYVCQAWNYALNFIFVRYRVMLADMKRFAPWFEEMASWLSDRGCPHDNLVGFVDGNDQFICRTLGPGGKRRLNLYQRSNYSLKKKRHALLWQNTLLVNGLTTVEGPYAGRHHDAGVLHHTSLIQDLKDISEELGSKYAVFGDAAYPLTAHCFPACKAPKGRRMSRRQRKYNLKMSRYRISVENVFAAQGQQWGFTQHTQNQRVGVSAVGQQYLARSFLHNCYTLLYDSLNSVQHGGFHSENPVTLEWYMDY